MLLSVVTTIYNSSDDLEEFYQRSLKAAEGIGVELELILVNDASPDDGLSVACALGKRDSRVKVVDLSRNVGQHRALWTGLRYASGDLVAMMDGDLDEDPLWLIDAHASMQKTESDVVYGIQATRRGSWPYRVSRSIFYRLLGVMTSADFPRNVTTFRLMKRKFVQSLRSFDEREIFLVGIMHMAGFKQVPMEVPKNSVSPTSYSFSKLAFVFITHTTSFSITPLMFVFIAGLLLMLASFGGVVALFTLNLINGTDVPGWASTTAIITMFSGMMLCFNGIIAIYVGTIFLEVKRRPVAIVNTVYGDIVDGQATSAPQQNVSHQWGALGG